MADDIDIEEHDVKDHPTFKNMFPDLTTVRREINYFGKNEEVTQQAFPMIKEYKQETILDINDENAPQRSLMCSTQTDTDVKPDITSVQCNFTPTIVNIELSGKEIVVHDIKREPDTDEPNDLIFYRSEVNESSRLNELNTYKEKTRRVNEQFSDVKQCLKVVVEDCSRSLLDNKCYCAWCQVLFPTTAACNEHYMSTHSETTVAMNLTPRAPAAETYRDTASHKCTDDNARVSKPHRCDAALCNDAGDGEETASRHIHDRSPTYLCDRCNRNFVSKRILIKHTVRCNVYPHKITINVCNQCDICKRQFKFPSCLERHMRLHTGEKPYPCNICKKRFTISSHLKYHMRLHTGVKPYLCNICKKTFTQSCHLKSHMTVHTGERPFLCNICKKRFTKSCHLKSHMRVHTGEKPYPCNICKKRFTSSSTLKIHIRVHTGEKPYPCNICKKRFTASCDLKSHMRVHTGEKPYPCNICKKRFTSSSTLKLHIRVHTGEKPYPCNICKKRFTSSDVLKTHMTVHTGEKIIEKKNKYECNICKKIYIMHSRDFRNHVQSHTGEQPQCDICKKNFSSYRDLKNHHMTTHTVQKLYPCEICKRTLKSYDSFRHHMRLHRNKGEKSYKCDICKTILSTAYFYKIHMSSHTGENPYEYRICKQSTRHLLSRHQPSHTTSSCLTIHKRWDEHKQEYEYPWQIDFPTQMERETQLTTCNKSFTQSIKSMKEIENIEKPQMFILVKSQVFKRKKD